MVIHPPTGSPERQLSKVASQGSRTLVFDAVEAGKEPGAVVCASLADTKFGFFATHNVPLKLVPGVAEHIGQTFVVGIQPMSLDVGEGLSQTVRAASESVVAAIEAFVGGSA